VHAAMLVILAVLFTQRMTLAGPRLRLRQRA
jgi:hypothetical protein